MIYYKKFRNILINSFQKNPHKIILIICFFSAFLALSTSYISEYIFDYQPCILCLYQRKPFWIILIVSSIIFFAKQRNFLKIAILICGIGFLTNFAISFYHSGVELKWFDGPKNCSANNLENITNLEELTAKILETKAVKCDIPQFYFLFLTMANWNMIYNFFLIIIIINLSYRKKINLN
jgi:disulfide bond formation protein DsbB